MSFSEKVQELNREISATFERALSGIRQEIAETLRGSHEKALERLQQLRPDLPETFVDHDALSPVADAMSARSREEGHQHGHQQGLEEGRRHGSQTGRLEGMTE